jgi:hypothetical protein
LVVVVLVVPEELVRVQFLVLLVSPVDRVELPRFQVELHN